MLFLSLIFLLFSPFLATADKKCRALVLQGGGDKGAYQAGALAEMLTLIPDEMRYDVVSGVSAGALNAGGFSQFPPGEERAAVEFLLDVWMTIMASDVFIEWKGGLINGLLYEPSLFDTSPLRGYLEEKFSRPMARRLSVGSVNADQGTYVRFNETIGREQLITAVLASAALPALFPYVTIDGEVFVDGGVLLGLDVDGAVERCRELVEEDRDIIVDVLLCSGASVRKVSQENDTTLQMLGRFLELHFYSNALDHLLHAFEDNPEVEFRYVIMPTKTLASDPFSLQFDRREIESMIEQGREDARERVLNGSIGAEYLRGEWRRMYGKRRGRTGL